MGGHGGSGKSLIGLVIASHVAAGKTWEPFEVHCGRVLIVSMEDTAEVVRYRLRNIISDYGLDPKLIQQNITLLDCTDLDALAYEINTKGRRKLQATEEAGKIFKMAKKYDLVLIDNSSDAYAADENVRHLVRAFIRGLVKAVRPSNGAILLLVHIDKAAARAGGGNQTYSGSTAWHNSARSRVAITDGKLRHEKHQFGSLHPEVLIEFNRNGVPILLDDATAKLKEELQLEEDKTEFLRLLAEAEATGTSITTSKTGPGNIWKQITAMPGFPAAWKDAAGGRGRLHAAIASLESDRLIRREQYNNAQRNKRRRWVLVTSLVTEKPTKATNGKPTK
jgi:hypothetical protein